MPLPRYLTDEELDESASDESEDEESDISDDNDDYVPEEDSSEYSTDSDDGEADESHESIISNENVDPLFVSKDGKEWSPQPVQNPGGRARSENVINLTPGTTRFAKSRVDNVKDAFLLFFPPPIEKIILKWSNEYALAKFGEEYTPLDSNLLRAYIGVLILAGVYR